MSVAAVKHPKFLSISGYTYLLPEERIAVYPAADRSGSKLLVYRNGAISDHKFVDLPEWLEKDDFLVFNESRVIHARLLFQKPTGSTIEILCLEPHSTHDPALALAAYGSCEWKVLVGNLKRWKDPVLTLSINTPDGQLQLNAELTGNSDEAKTVRFTYDAHRTFSEVIECAGKIPLPPYLNRTAEAIDEDRYQTVYAKSEGSVAAPTAGLHFTPEVLGALQTKGIRQSFVTLHVGAGTFRPVKAERMGDHQMHEETIIVHQQTIRDLLQQLKQQEASARGKIIAVGTTATRTLESLYWFGVMLANGEAHPKHLEQWYPYENPSSLSAAEALNLLLNHLEENSLQEFRGSTGILIAPGYGFKIVDALVTNFHQPDSTLLLLVAAFVGEDWRRIYQHALENGYRFLSYGDSSLLFRG